LVDGSGFQIGVNAPQHYEEQVGRFMAPFVARLVESSVRPRDQVVDVACGTGFASRAVAQAVGDNGRVVGVDINPAMIATARSVLQDEGYDVELFEASALELPFDDHEFDAVVCQQGIQFFPDVGSGLVEMSRVVRPGGRLGATVWAPIEASPFLDVETRALVNHCGVDGAAAAQAFPPGGSEQIATWFQAAGLDAGIQLVEADVALPPVDVYVPEHLKALPWSAEFFGLAERQKRAVLSEIGDGLQEFRTDDGMTVPFRSYLINATI